MSRANKRITKPAIKSSSNSLKGKLGHSQRGKNAKTFRRIEQARFIEKEVHNG